MAGHILSVTVKMKAHVSGPLSAGNDEYKQRWGRGRDGEVKERAMGMGRRAKRGGKLADDSNKLLISFNELHVKAIFRGRLLAAQTPLAAAHHLLNTTS